MPDIPVECLGEMECYTGSFERGQKVFLCGQESRSVQARHEPISMPPKWEQYPEHDHAADNEEELYIVLEGSGTLHADGQTIQCSGAS